MGWFWVALGAAVLVAGLADILPPPTATPTEAPSATGLSP